MSRVSPDSITQRSCMTVFAQAMFVILAVVLAVRALAVAAGRPYRPLARGLAFVVAPLCVACAVLTVLQLAATLQG
jgi:hypothetical protein